MDQSTMQWTREAINNIQSNLTVRIREGNLSNRDQQMMANMMAEIQKELENQTAANEAVRELYENLGRIQEELTAPITREVADRIEATAAAAGRNLDELEKVNHIANALQLDAQSIIPLLEQLQQKQNEMRQSFQKAVDIDFQLYGKTSSLTERALEAYHFAKDHSSKQAEPEIKKSPAAFSEKRELYQEGDRIKLKIPNVTPEEKKAIENQLFQAGARYYKGTIPAEESNTGKEVNYTSWYVKYKEGMDLSAFSPYIKGKPQQKPSVLKQLDKNKKQAGEGKEKLPEEMEKKSPEMER